MLWVGLTGGTGSGKSTVARLLERAGAVVLDADRLAREVVEPGTPALARIAAHFGPQVLNSDGTLDRAGLAGIVFADPARLRTLEDITHPAIEDRTRQLRAGLPAGTVAVHDSPLIVEKGTAADYHLLVVVDAPAALRVDRLAGRGMDPGDARNRIATQASTGQRRQVADVWLDNSGTPADLEPLVEALWQRLTRYEQNLRTGVPADWAQAPEPDPHSGPRATARLTRCLAGLGAVDLLDPVPDDDGLRIGIGIGAHLLDRLPPALAGAGLVPAGPGRYRSADPGQRLLVTTHPH